VPRQEYSRELKLAAMREIDSGKGMAEVARMYQLSPKRLETWRSEWRAKGELAFPGKGAQPKANSMPIGSVSWNVRSASRRWKSIF
jgi:transposase-like protein